ncbi:hypothetical protein J3R82DRAFT_825 [Butyriboletus roseoflavus]|nr:hypothetical protein J3R82DRAFT_825 [Butyriboletus roseoflavus]
MSPRRMDISSLLRHPSPPPDDSPAPRPRTIDALLHHPPASLLSILNSPKQRPHTPSPADHPHPRPPFLGLDALVHVASEERRRITAVSASSLPDRDLLATHLNRDRFPEPASFVHDQDRLSRHYTHPLSSYPAPLHRHPDPPSPFQDNLRPHKRSRDAGPPSPPRSPSPFPLVPSPSTRHHSSASPTTNYPTLRRQPMEPTHSTPALLVGPVNDARTILHPPSVPLQHTSPFLHSLHFSQLPIHSSPRNNSPHRYSPQHLRSQHQSFPLPTGVLIPPSTEADAMSPRYGYGPRMAGGIEVLSNDPPSIRDSPRPDLANYQSPGRDMSAQRLLSDSRAEHPWHELPKLSPLPRRATFLDDDRHQVKALPHQVEGQESVLLRERVRSRPPHSPLVDATADNDKTMGVPTREVDLPPQPPPERHPFRVWEDQPIPRETSRRVSPVHMPNIVYGLAEGRTWSGASESGHGKRPAKDDRETELRQDVAEEVPTPPLSTRKEPSPPRAQPLEPVPSDLRAPNEGTRLDTPPLTPNPIQPRTPVQSEPQAHLPQASLPNSSTPRAPASPVLDLHLKNFEIQSELQPERSDTNVDTTAPLTSSDPTITEPLLTKAELIPDPPPRQPSPELAQPVPAKEPGGSGISTRSTHANASQSTSRSSSQQPLPAKDEDYALPEDKLISPPIQPEPASPEPEYTSEREPPVSEQTMMDVDEELLSLVEDHPPRAVPAMSKAQNESRSPLPTTVGQGTGAGAEQRTSEASDGPLSALSSQPVPRGPPLMTDEEKDRASMPPPAARNKKAEKDKTTLVAGTATGSKKKKDGTSKVSISYFVTRATISQVALSDQPAAKPKQPPKPRAKPTPKPKPRPNVVDIPLKGTIPKGAVNLNARSRSTSVIPGAVDDVVPEPEADESDKEDNKLYCVCKTRYDEDRMMIACDRCDEWFHTLCVNMLDLEIDLVDQFICPPCIQKHSHLRTTWKRRCLFGLQHENPSSPEACHRPSRGAFSKYCSDDCGIKYMRVHIAQWEKSGGARGLLWESVKNAAKREGVVVCAKTNVASPPRMMDIDSNNSKGKPLDSAAKRRAEREVTRLNARLEEVVKERELMKRELDMVMWREKVVELASERAGKVDECGWDQRLCFGEEEWADFGPEVLESYEEERVKANSGDDTMSLDVTCAMHGEWWCTGKKKCERHAGWQKLRAAEVSFDKETKEGILLKLTTREREIRKRIEDMLYPQPTGTLQAPYEPPHREVQLNGSENARSTGHVSEKRGGRSS